MVAGRHLENIRKDTDEVEKGRMRQREDETVVLLTSLRNENWFRLDEVYVTVYEL